MPEAISTPYLVALTITSQELDRRGLFCPPTKIVLSNSPTTMGLKAGFPCQINGIFKQYTEEVLILIQVGLVFFTTSMKYEFQAF